MPTIVWCSWSRSGWGSESLAMMSPTRGDSSSGLYLKVQVKVPTPLARKLSHENPSWQRNSIRIDNEAAEAIERLPLRCRFRCLCPCT